MLHRYLRLIVSTAILVIFSGQLNAQVCPDVYPQVLGPASVREGQMVEYFAPKVPGHTYFWVFPVGVNMGVSYDDANYTYQQVTWPAIAGGIQDFQVELQETYLNCTDNKIITVHVNPLLQAYFYYQARGCYYNIVTFTGDVSVFDPLYPITDYSWDFGDGSPPSHGANQTHTFSGPFPGTYTVTLTVANARGLTDQIIDYVYVDPDKNKPVAVIDTPVLPNCLYTPVNFSGANSLPKPVTNPISILMESYSWNFDDVASGVNNTSSSINPIHTFSAPGNYHVTLKVINDRYCDSTISVNVTIQNTVPIASFTNNTPCFGSATQFTDTSIPSIGSITWSWNFGDASSGGANTSTLQNPTHIYTQATTYHPTLTVTNTNGCTNTYTPSTPVTVNPAPDANFDYSAACIGENVHFTNTSSAAGGSAISGYVWNINGDPFYTPNPDYPFPSAGTFPVSLTVTNGNGCSDQIVENVVVNPKPDIDFTFLGTIIPYQFTFTAQVNASQFIGNNMVWEFGDGSGPGHGKIVTHTFPGPGSFVVRVTGTDMVTGCSNFIEYSVSSGAPPSAFFTATPPDQCQGSPIAFTSGPPGGPITEEIWDYHDGTVNDHFLFPNCPANPTHTFAATGPYWVTRTINPGTPLEATWDVYGTIYPNPGSQFNWFSDASLTWQGKACADQDVYFRDQSFSNSTPAGNIYKWSWDFGDPGSGPLNNFSTLQNPTHIFRGIGPTFNVTLTVWDNLNNCQNTTSIVVTVNPAIPVEFTYTDFTCLDHLVNFVPVGLVPYTDYTWLWNFGDGSPTSNTPGPISHLFTAIGTWTVTLTLTDKYGCSKTKQHFVTIIPLPIANFIFTAPTCEGKPIQFTDQSIPPPGYPDIITGWNWDFGNLLGTSTLQNPSYTYPLFNPAGYDVTLTVTTSRGCVSSKTLHVQPFPAPVANFEVMLQTPSCATQLVQFHDLSQEHGGGTIVTWNWNFGDLAGSGSNNTSTAQNPTHIFNTAGTYNVTLMVTNGNGCDSTKMIQIDINPLPVADFSAPDNCEGDPTVFTNTSTTTPVGTTINAYNWDFGDGGTSNLVNTQHTYATYGIKTVTLTVVNSNGCISSIQKQVTVFAKPTAEFIYSPSGCLGNPVVYTNQSFVPGGFSGYINQWVWNFGDGSAPVIIAWPANPNIPHTFLGIATSHIVRLTVTTTSGCSAFIEHTVTSIPSPKANFAFSNTRCIGQAVQFTDLSQTNGGPGLQNWLWNFDDVLSGASNTSTLQSPPHTFASIGNHIVTLVVTSVNGCTNQYDSTIVINALPLSDFSNTTACEGTGTLFTNLTLLTDTIVSYLWEFGDGQTSAIPSPTHIYATYGTKSVRLTVTTNKGCIKDTVKQVLVNPKPIPEFSFSTPSCIGSVVMFTNQSTVVTGFVGPIETWVWNFGDGSAPITITWPANPNIPHTFPGIATSHTVRLTVTTTNGCTAFIEHTVTSLPSPVANFASSTINCIGQVVQFTDLSSTNGGPSIQNWLWDFGDPISGASNTSPLQSPPHTFASIGPHIITLTVTSVNGCTNLFDSTIIINALPHSDFSYIPSCEGTGTLFTNLTLLSDTVVSYLWEFGDGQTSAIPNPSHVYATYGTKSVRLTVSNNKGCIKDTLKQVLVNPKPIPEFSFPSSNCLGSAVLFTNLSTTVTGYVGRIDKWIWNFGDGSPDTTINWPDNPNKLHTFLGSATGHTVRLTVITITGCIAYIEHTVTSVPSPLVEFGFPTSNCAKQSVQFTDLSQQNGGGNILQWSWNFGDAASGGNNLSIAKDPIHLFSGPGAFVVTLTVTNASNCPSTKDTTITIIALPLANFRADTACLGSITTFTDLSNATGTITQHLWDFGDGLTSISASPTHLYSTSGVFSVKLLVTTIEGCHKDTTKLVLVLPSPISAFATSAPACSGDSVQFTDLSSTAHGSIRTWFWDFGDGKAITMRFPASPNVRHLYTNGGTYNVTLTITTSDSCKAIKVIPVEIQPAPLANFSYATVRCALMPVAFTDLSQVNGGSALTQWEWNFGDPGSGNANTSTTRNPSHSFTSGGNFRIHLTVTSANGCSDSDTTQIVSVNAAPLAKFSSDTACVGSDTHFTDASTPNAASFLAWLWDFGDPSSGTNNTSTLQSPTHLFSGQGLFLVRLTVTNSNSCIKDTLVPVAVNPKPTAMFSSNASCVFDSTAFTDLSIAPGSQVDSWLWNFGDGSTSTLQNPKHAYATSGNFNVTLTVTNLSGCLDSITIPITARPKPVSAFTYTSYFCPAGLVNFEDQSQGTGAAITEHYWVFEPGIISTKPNPSYTFPVTDTTYLVMLIVTDNFGCKDTISDSVHVKPGFKFTFVNDTVCFNDYTHFRAVNQADGDTLYNLRWDFGDPNSGPNNNSTLYNPPHLFSAPGIYPVKLRAINSDNCPDSVYHNVTVYKLPEPSFTFNSQACDSTIRFSEISYAGSGSISSWEWDFGDGSPLVTIPAPGHLGHGDTSHLYSSQNSFYVVLKITNSNGCVDTISQLVESYPCILASFTHSDTLLCANYPITFSDSSLTASRIDQWHWIFGDGNDTLYSTHTSDVTHRYANGGTYVVNLVISASISGRTFIDTMSKLVTINPTPLTQFANKAVCLDQITLFTDTTKTYGARISSWNWTFGEPTSGVLDTSSVKNPSHTYDTAGIYNVQLVVMNQYGCKDSLTKPTRIFAVPIAHFNNSVACSGNPTYFNDRTIIADTSIFSWHWNFGEVSSHKDTSLLEDPSHQYKNEGTYQVKLIVKDKNGCYDTADSSVVVNVTPLSAFTVTEKVNNMIGKIKLNNNTVDADSFFWDFGDPTIPNSTDESPIVTYSHDDTYLIMLVSSNSFHCSDTTYFQYKVLFKGLYIPNAFAPSSGVLGVSLFQPVGVNIKEGTYLVEVFDTWGHLMWQSKELDTEGHPVEGWDGKDPNGNQSPAGTYMWKINATFNDGSLWEGSDIGKGDYKTIGTVTLIR